MLWVPLEVLGIAFVSSFQELTWPLRYSYSFPLNIMFMFVLQDCLCVFIACSSLQCVLQQCFKMFLFGSENLSYYILRLFYWVSNSANAEKFIYFELRKLIADVAIISAIYIIVQQSTKEGSYAIIYICVYYDNFCELMKLTKIYRNIYSSYIM